MKAYPWLVSLALHAAVLSVAYCHVTVRVDESSREIEVPISLEFVEESIKATDEVVPTPEKPTSDSVVESSEEEVPKPDDTPPNEIVQEQDEAQPEEATMEVASSEQPEAPCTNKEDALPDEVQDETREVESANEIMKSAEDSSQVETIAAEPVVSVKPRYPRKAQRRGIEGVVRVRVLIMADGSVGKVSVESSSGSTDLDNAACEAAKGSKFKAGLRAGIPEDGEIVMTFDFRLK